MSSKPGRRVIPVGAWLSCVAVLSLAPRTSWSEPPAEGTPEVEPLPAGTMPATVPTEGEATKVEPPPAVGPPAEGAPTGEQPAVSPKELEELMKGLSADQPAKPSESAPSASPSGSSWISGAIQSMNPDIAVILDAAGAYFSVDDPLQSGDHDPSHTGFNLQQVELSIGATVDPFFRFDSNIVFSLDGVELEEAYASSLALPVGLQVRAGQMLTRFGRINPTHPHAWSFVDQPIVMSKLFGGEGSRGLGLEVSWLTPLPWYVEVVAEATEATGEGTARSFFGASDPGIQGLEDFLYSLALKQFFPFDEAWSMSFGLSAQLGPNATGDGNRSGVYGTDLYFRFRPVGSQSRTALSLTIEGLLRTREVPGDLLVDYGGYTQLVWSIDPEWEVGARAELVSGIDNDPLDPEWTSNRSRYSVEAAFYPSHFSRLRLQGSIDDPTFRDSPIYAAVLALEVTVGAHGAHTF